VFTLEARNLGKKFAATFTGSGNPGKIIKTKSYTLKSYDTIATSHGYVYI
jgi:hypothetical protein